MSRFFGIKTQIFCHDYSCIEAAWRIGGLESSEQRTLRTFDKMKAVLLFCVTLGLVNSIHGAIFNENSKQSAEKGVPEELNVEEETAIRDEENLKTGSLSKDDEGDDMEADENLWLAEGNYELAEKYDSASDPKPYARRRRRRFYRRRSGK
ncbi:uncharacterized protein LOC135694175 [Rhopilema esculentum]|uniref:uncharacterized protein LOC135694175 n=1 Tax=Rhopilema esculentum TaxID=499914 RepID=UPI0031E31682